MLVMAAISPERNARLDKLLTLTENWSTKTQEAYRRRADQLTRMLKGRNAGAIGAASVGAVSELVVKEIDDFLVG